MKIMNQDCGSKEGKIEERLPLQNGKVFFEIKKKARAFSQTHGQKRNKGITSD